MKKEIKLSSFSELWEMLADSLPTMPEPPESAPEAGDQQEPPAGQAGRETPCEDNIPSANANADDPPEPADPTEPKHVAVPEEQRTELDETGTKYLERIRYFASWQGEDRELKLAPLLALLDEKYPGHQAEIDGALAAGTRDADLFRDTHNLGVSNSEKARADFREMLDNLPADAPSWMHERLREQFDRGGRANERLRIERQRKQNGQPLSSVKARTVAPTSMPKRLAKDRRGTNIPIPDALHANDLRALAPGAKWTLLIDESGSIFDETATSARRQRLGRFVGLLLSAEGRSLPPLAKGWHAVECDDPAQIDQAVQTVLDAQVGVLGIEVKAVPMATGERWLDGVALLIDWVLRLMPVDELCRLEVAVEQRGTFAGGSDWNLVRRSCLRRLALAFPKRAAKIDLAIRTIGKDGHPANGYVDAIAYTWAVTSDSSRERLKLSIWRGTCLLGQADGVDACAMLDAWDTFAQGVNLPPETWWRMLRSPEARQPAALLGTFLAHVGAEAKADGRRWSEFLNQTKQCMAAGPVDLSALAAAVDWLQAHQPDNADIPPSLRLVWLTVQLARANHMGQTEIGWQAELESLADRLFDEAAPLVCHADLHRAVTATNRFDFAAAGKALDRWRDQPPAVPGLRYWAQVVSSFGQHAAFTGDQPGAVVLFRQAMDAFGRLSDPEARKRDRAQTGCYLAIAMIDDQQGNNDAEARAAVEQIVGPLPEAAAQLAASTDPADRYRHHLLLRWLVHRGDADAWQSYLNCRNQWDVGAGHPWPLIQLYRGMLLRAAEPDAAVKLALDAAARAGAPNQGPTVRFIGACCRAIAATWGAPWPEAESELDWLAEALPAAANSLAAVRACLRTPQKALPLLAEALPFNFR